MRATRVGLALGGGGVRGLAHALVLEALDELGCQPAIVAGTSIGAVIGAIYASGVPGKVIRERIEASIVSSQLGGPHNLFRRRSELLRVVHAVEFESGPGGFCKPARFLDLLLAAVHQRTFEELRVPLLVVATDYWKCEPVVFDSGELAPALRASIAIPGIFAPVKIGDRVLVDGGLVELVPYERVLRQCDVSIAVDVSGARQLENRRTPTTSEAILGSVQLMQNVALAERLRRSRPDVLVRPEIVDVSLLAFWKAAEVLRQTAPAVMEMKKALEVLLSARS